MDISSYKSLIIKSLTSPAIKALSEIDEKNLVQNIIDSNSTHAINVAQIELLKNILVCYEYSKTNNPKIQDVLMNIAQNLLPNSPTILEIIISNQFHVFLVDKLHDDECFYYYHVWYPLIQLIQIADHSLIEYFHSTGILEVIHKILIETNNDDILICAFLALSNFIYKTNNIYQDEICSIINFHDISARIDPSHDSFIIAGMNLISSIIHSFHFVPQKDNFVRIILDIFDGRELSFFAIYESVNCLNIAIECEKCIIVDLFYKRIKSDDRSIFEKFYFYFIYKEIRTDFPRFVLNLYISILNVFLNSEKFLRQKINENPDNEEELKAIYCFHFQDTFEIKDMIKAACNYRKIIPKTLKFLKNVHFLNANDNETKIIQFLKYLIKQLESFSYQNKVSVLKYLITVMSYNKNEELIRKMYDCNILFFLIECLTMTDDKKFINLALDGIITITDVLTQCINGYEVRKNLIDQNFEDVILYLRNFEDQTIDVKANFLHDAIYGEIC